MTAIYLLFKHSGTWVEPGCYHENGSFGIMVPYEVNFASLMQIIYANLGKSPSTHTIGVAYAMAGAMKPVEITNDATLEGYLYLRKMREDDTEKLQLILEINEIPSGLDSPGVGSTCNSRDSGCVGNPPRRVSDMPSIPEEGCGSVPTPDSVIRGTFGLDDLRLSDYETQRQQQRQRQCSPPRNSPPPINSRSPPPPRNSPPTPSQNSRPTSPSTPNSQSVPSSSTRKDANMDDAIILDGHSPVFIERHALYKDKKTLQKHLMLFAINNNFTYKTKNSDKNTLHVVCLGEHCNWAVRAVRKANTPIFQIRR